MGIKRHGFPVRVLALATVLAVHTAACAGSTAPYTAAAPSPSATEAAATTAIPAADAPTQPVATTPTARSRAVEEESNMTPPPTVQDLELSAEAERVVQLARQDLAWRLGMALEQILFVSVQEVQWRDASLGCPWPNARYAQVITPGFRVVLEAQGKTYEYHSDAGQRLVLCQGGLPSYPLIPVKPGQIMDGRPWMPAD